MHIKEIELQNFKSFGKKVKIPFFDDFTTISGPNGSGKSNIIDGILFALGLSSSRVLRAEKLTDLIYNGDGARTRDFAQVTICFDNKDREMPVDSDEVVITRKVRQTESGYYSYYYFNEKAVGLADIHNYLSKAKITPEGYNVVMQGDVTSIIEMTTTERRKIIDEIAGVAEFDDKKEQALNELEIVRERIERVDIIIGEVDDQLAKLKQERDQALKYQSLRDEKRKYEGYILLARQKDAKNELRKLEGELKDKETNKEEFTKQVEQRKYELREIEEKLSDLNSLIIQKGEGEQIALKKEIESIRGEISRCISTIEIAENEINDIESQKRKAFVEIDNVQGKVAQFNEKLNEETRRCETISGEIGDKNTQLLVLKSRIAEVDASFSDTKDRLDETKQKLEALKNEKNEFMREEDRLLDAIRRKSSEARDRELEMQDSLSKIQSADFDAASAKAQIEEINAKKQELAKDAFDLEKNRAQIKSVLSDLENQLRTLQQEYAKSEARIKAAAELNYSEPVESVLRARKNRELPGIYGTIAELGKVDKKFSVALEIAAGARMQAVVVDNDEDAARAINYLKERRLGRVTFLPLNKMESMQKISRAEKEGVIDYAINLVEYDKKFDPAFWYVFKDTLVSDSLATARRLMGGRRLVTLEGELIEKAGAMTGGTIRSKLSFASGEAENIKKIAEEIAEHEGRRKSSLAKLEKFEEHLEQAKAESLGFDNEITKLGMQMTEIMSRGTRLAQVIETRKKELDEIERERAAIKKDMDSVEDKKREKDAVINKLLEEISKIEEQLSGSEVPELNSKASLIEDEIQRLEGRLRDIEAGINAVTLERRYAQAKIDEIKEQISLFDKKKNEHREKINGLKEKIKTLESELNIKNTREKELSVELLELQNKRSLVQKEHSSIKERLDDILRMMNDMERNLLALYSTKDALTEQIIKLDNDIAELGINRDEEVPSSESIAQRILALTRAMEKLEPVNMRAIDEYNEVENRQKDLKSRRDILFHEREEILLRIKKYEELKKEAFMDTFNGVNEQFKQVFAELSDGTGELFLENPDVPFSGGMTIKAQPSEKTLQRLEAMSGGEKSLTALSLLFAIQQYRPAPFYAFDEIDMFLDGVNAEKVARRIQKAAANAQFIVVSLRKPMIEAAKRTIGVAMQESNISSITGIKLN
ncbi:MAG: chromosome segregation protein SMC [Candidatus Methanoperedens sp.]|nr:chromosome segregation protein SMC [Candidatus Methanoperedens sp.]MCZ7396603.1 chromosome segregation protein SMC [Candidatus Methanoperedens sp.]